MHALRNSARKCLTQWEALQNCNCLHLLRHMSAEPIPVPAPDNTAKLYPPKIEKLVSDIASLSLLEVSELSELLKKRLNLPDAPMMPVGGFAPVGPVADTEEEAKEVTVKNTFNVKITQFDEKQKVALIKVVKSVVEGMNLVQAKKFVESAPVLVKGDVDKEEAEKLQKELIAVGAEVVLE